MTIKKAYFRSNSSLRSNSNRSCKVGEIVAVAGDRSLVRVAVKDNGDHKYLYGEFRTLELETDSGPGLLETGRYKWERSLPSFHRALERYVDFRYQGALKFQQSGLKYGVLPEWWFYEFPKRTQAAILKRIKKALEEEVAYGKREYKREWKSVEKALKEAQVILRQIEKSKYRSSGDDIKAARYAKSISSVIEKIGKR